MHWRGVAFAGRKRGAPRNQGGGWLGGGLHGILLGAPGGRPDRQHGPKPVGRGRRHQSPPHDGQRSQVGGSGGRRAVPRRWPQRQSRDAARAHLLPPVPVARHAGDLRPRSHDGRSRAGRGDARRGREACRAGGLRHHLHPWHAWHATRADAVAFPEPPLGQVRRLLREPGPAVGRDPRKRARGRGRALRPRQPLLDRPARRGRRCRGGGRGRGVRRARHPRGARRPLGRQRRRSSRMGRGYLRLAFPEEQPPEGLHGLRQVHRYRAGLRGRSLH